MKMTISQVSFPLREPFVITGYVFEHTKAVHVRLERDGFVGRGEGVGCYYLGETVETMAAQLEAVVPVVEAGATRQDIQALLPPGGARCALDCAFWDLEAKSAGMSIWDLLNISPRILNTVVTIGIDTPEVMGAAASRLRNIPDLKLKLNAELPVERVEAVRAAHPAASIVVDVNQGWSLEELKVYAPEMTRLNVAMIEQPLRRGSDNDLLGFDSPVPLGADESCLSSEEFDYAVARYDVINIKIDKTGGLTDALKIVELAKRGDCDLMVGNMTGSSLGMAPSYVIGQFCRFVDVDGPLLLAEDVSNPMIYPGDGTAIMPGPALWG